MLVRPKPLRAIQVTAGNLDQLQQLISDVKPPRPGRTQPRISWPNEAGEIELVIGTWLVRHPTGRIEVLSNADFTATYEEVV